MVPRERDKEITWKHTSLNRKRGWKKPAYFSLTSNLFLMLTQGHYTTKVRIKVPQNLWGEQINETGLKNSSCSHLQGKDNVHDFSLVYWLVKSLFHICNTSLVLHKFLWRLSKNEAVIPNTVTVMGNTEHSKSH